MLYVLPAGGGARSPGVRRSWAPGMGAQSPVSPPTSWPVARRPRVKILHPFKQQFKQNESGITTVSDEDEFSRSGKSLSECYFASKGAAVVLSSGSSPGGGTPSRGGSRRPPPASASSSDIQQHLQSMFYLLRPEETLKMAVKLESAHPGRTRYLVVVSRGGSGSNGQGSRAEEACLLGIDCNRRTTVGLVLRVLADTAITLDGDGGFSVSVAGRQHIFKPVSVQAMWSALQTLHRVSSGAREQNYFMGGNSHSWVNYYEQCIHSDRSCLNEWHAMDSIESRRPPSPDSVRTKPREREETEQVIRSTLKEIMMSVDLDEVTSKVIRGRLEEDLDMDLGEFKPFIDQEMITILGQMDAPTEIFDHVYLGSEWNASNLEELQKNGVRHILNVTREIDNFFPGMFNYLNIRVYDDEKTDLLKHWDKTFKYISRARKEGSKVLVHCKMGVSRSASVVIAYAMKAFDWDFSTAMKHVKEKRNCIKPNTSFLSQLETYQGILDAMKNKEKLQRSKSETNLKSPGSVCKTDSRIMEPTPLIQALTGRCRSRPRSWSPDTRLASQLLPPTSLSLENLAQETKNVLMPCANGSYSVSQNRIMRLREDGVPSVKHIVNELESQAAASEKKTQRERRNLKLNLANHIGSAEGHNCDVLSSSNVDVDAGDKSEECEAPGDSSSSQYVDTSSSDINIDVVQSKETVNKTETWDPGESKGSGVLVSNLPCDLNEIVKCDSGIVDVRTKSACASKQGDPFSKQVDNVFEKEERRSGEAPSRQGSWSSCDSAVVLERNSSWGSYDTRPSRNSSWSSYDEQWSTGTVKRTKQKLEENSVKKICPDGDLAPSEVNEAINTVLTNKLSIVIPSACDLDIINENHEQSSVSVINSDNSVVVSLKDATGASTDSGGCEVRDMCRKSDNVSAILRELEYAGDELSGVNRVRNTKFIRLSASAPTASSNYFEKKTTSPSASSVGNIFSSKNIDLPKTSIVKAFFHSKHKNKIDNFKVDKTRVNNANNNNNNSRSISGKVKNLKMEFEAKSNLNNEASSRNLLNVDASIQNVNVENNNKTKGRSLPSSPVSIHTEIRSKPIVDDDTESNGGQVGQSTSLEDLTVKQLVGKYDRPKSQQITSKTNFAEPPVPMRQSSLNLDTKKKQPNPGARNSICGGIPPRNPAVTLRPPVVPTVVAMSPVSFPTAKVVVASVVAKAQTKKQLQHGKTHPLARLKNHTTNRCTNPVYNTM